MCGHRGSAFDFWSSSDLYEGRCTGANVGAAYDRPMNLSGGVGLQLAAAFAAIVVAYPALRDLKCPDPALEAASSAHQHAPERRDRVFLPERYDMDAAELAALLNAYRERALGPSRAGP
jgi:hypothetical protein